MPKSRSRTGTMKAATPKRRNKVKASQAPMGPPRLWGELLAGTMLETESWRIVGEQGEQDQEAEASKDDAEHVIQAARRRLSWVFPSHGEKCSGRDTKFKALLDWG